VRDHVAKELASAPTAADERYFNDDLADADLNALQLERARLRAALVIAARTDPWVLGRVRLIEAELKARHAR
jgi:hypothetical protein